MESRKGEVIGRINELSGEVFTIGINMSLRGRARSQGGFHEATIATIVGDNN
jgi:hypothetical protein